MLHDTLRRADAHLGSAALDLPLLPVTATKVLSLVSSPRADARALSTLIHRDPALAAHTLHLANSSAFGGAAKIVTLQQAITRIGFRLVGAIATAAAVERTVFRLPGHEREVAAMWRRALTRAAWAREVARSCRANVETAFLCGLLQTVGRPMAFAAAVHTGANGHPELEPWLNQAQVGVGVRLASSWALPSAVSAAIAQPWGPIPHDRFGEVIAITRLAESLASWSLLQEEIEAHHPSFDRLDLYPPDLTRIQEAADRVEDLATGVTA